MIDPKIAKALEHLESAEASIMSHVVSFSEAANVDVDEEQDMATITLDLPDPFHVLLAVLRSVSRAAGVLEAIDQQ